MEPKAWRWLSFTLGRGNVMLVTTVYIRLLTAPERVDLSWPSVKWTITNVHKMSCPINFRYINKFITTTLWCRYMSTLQVRKLRQEILPNITELNTVRCSFPLHYVASGSGPPGWCKSKLNLKCMSQKSDREERLLPTLVSGSPEFGRFYYRNKWNGWLNMWQSLNRKLNYYAH